jgi:hypothetical protein
MNQQPLDDVVMTPQVGSSHISGFENMHEASFDSFSPTSITIRADSEGYVIPRASPKYGRFWL